MLRARSPDPEGNAMLRSILAALTVLVTAVAAHTDTAASADGPPGSITFVAANLMSTANGVFHDWRIVRAEIDSMHPERGVVEVEVDVASLDTGIEQRDEHLRTPDFFDVEQFPTATVRVHSVQSDGTSERGRPRYAAKFEIRIRDVSRTLDGTFELVSDSPPTVEGELTIDRVDFGVGGPYAWWNPASIGEEIPVHFAVAFAH
jgi:polyisoprenoid-binding protein YceI